MKKYINRYNISMALAIIGTILSAIGWVGLMRGSQSAASFITFGILIAMLAYVFGGLLTALRMASSIAKWGIFFDRFPFNLLNMLASCDSCDEGQKTVSKSLNQLRCFEICENTELSQKT